MRARHVRAGVLWLAAVLIPTLAPGQGVRDLALAWALGDYRAPLACVLDGTARQALRRVRIHPGRPSDRPSVRLNFHDLEAPPGISCSSMSGEPEPNVVGELELVFEGRSRPDTGEVDFRNALRREGGFTFRVSSGRLRIGAAGATPAELAAVDLPAGPRSGVPLRQRRASPAAFGPSGSGSLSATTGEKLAFELVELSPR
jgi:hypothetical protein